MITVRLFGILVLSSLFLLTGPAASRAQANHPDTLLLDACLNGPVKEVVRLLDKEGANPDARRGGDGWTPLMLAAMNGYTDVVRILLEHNANPNLGNNEEGTPLCVAASSFILPDEGPNAIVDLLLERGADVYEQNGSGMIALMYAAREGKTATVERLLEAGTNVNYMDVREWSALWLAVNNDQVETVAVLLAAGANPDAHGEMYTWTPLNLTAQNNNTEMARLLLDGGADPNGRPSGNDYFPSPLWFAAKNNNVELVRLLLEKNALPNYSDGGYWSEDEKPRTPLDWAKELGNKEMETLLRDAGAIEDLEGTYMEMLEAVRNGDAKKFRALMDQKIDPRRYVFAAGEGITLLDEAAQRGNIEIVQAILSFPLPPNSYELFGAYQTAAENNYTELAEEIIRFAPGEMILQAVDGWQPELMAHILEIEPEVANYSDKNSQTPLYLAVASGDMGMAEALLVAGADVNGKDRWGESPLFESARLGSTEIAELLLEWGADVEHRSKNGMTPLHAAVMGEDTGMVIWLVEHDANVYSTDYQGWNALHFAAWRGTPEIARLLISMGIEPTWRNDLEERPIDLALRSGNDGVQAVLEEEHTK